MSSDARQRAAALCVLAACLCLAPVTAPAVAAPASEAASVVQSGSAPDAMPQEPDPDSAGMERSTSHDVLEEYLTRSASSVYFVHGSLVLSGQSLDTITENAQRLKNNPDETVTLIGYLEDQGSRSYSVALAEQRTAVVKEALQELGVSIRQIRSGVFTQEPPDTAPCQTEICRASYRRVQFLYTKSR